MDSLSSLQLDAFVAVCRTRSFSQAAERLHVTQSALSQRIINLEESLEATLFIRERTGVRLTDLGEELLRYCQSKNALESEFLSRLKTAEGKLAGEIRIGGFSSVMRSVILPSLAGLLRENPGIRLNLLTRELRQLPEMLKQGEIDFMILDHELERESLKTVRLGTEENVLVQARDLDVPDVYLDHDEEDEATYKYLRLAGRKNPKVERRFLDDIYGLLDGAKSGLGKAVLPKHIIRGSKELKILNPEITLKIPVFLHFHNQPYYPSLHSAVIHALAKNCLA